MAVVAVSLSLLGAKTEIAIDITTGLSPIAIRNLSRQYLTLISQRKLALLEEDINQFLEDPYFESNSLHRKTSMTSGNLFPPLRGMSSIQNVAL